VIKSGVAAFGNKQDAMIVGGDKEKFISRSPFSVGYPKRDILAGLGIPITVFLTIVIWFVRRKPVVLNNKY